MKGRAILIFFILFFFTPIIIASGFDATDIFSYDVVVPSRDKHAFYTGENVDPARSDFSVVSQLFLSNEKGNRLAVVSFKNLSSGTRTLSRNDIIAVLANGDKVFPGNVNFELLGGDEKSTAIDFGYQIFPILYVYTRN